uniref:Uncharacterized protein n=1 Tax=Hyaloperonospora arabidopsidis (strain Emoy2) TaxID=559515 RepID=M4C5C5_HYAAE
MRYTGSWSLRPTLTRMGKSSITKADFGLWQRETFRRRLWNTFVAVMELITTKVVLILALNDLSRREDNGASYYTEVNGCKIYTSYLRHEFVLQSTG